MADITAPTAPGIPGAAPVTALPNNGGAAPASSPLLVTSGSSRSTYNNNVTALNTATTNQAVSQQNASTTPKATTSTPVDTNYYLKTGETIDAYNSRIASYNASKNASQQSIQTNGSDTTTPPKTTTNPDGSTSNVDGSPTTTSDQTAGNVADGALKAGIDPTLVKAFNDNYAALSSQADDANQTLEAAKATAANDPALAAAISQIQSQFGVLIDAMTKKNAQVLGRAGSEVAAFGGLGSMNENFLSDEQSSALNRVADLQSKETSLILKTQMAYQANDVKAVNAASAEYQKTLQDKQKAVIDLQTKINDAVKSAQAQQKIDAANAKQQVTTDISKSTNLGKSLADEIAKSGVTDPAQIEQYIQGMASQYGISNPDILKSAVVKAQQDQQKLDTSTANTADTIANRDANTTYRTNKPYFKPTVPGTGKGSGTDGTYKYQQTDIDTYSSFLNNGGTLKDGTKVAARGKDGYVDPTAYVTALNDWTSNGGTPAGFAKKFPVKTNLNPASYGVLPDSIQPKKAATTANAPL